MVEQALRGWISSQGGYIHPDLHLFAEDLVKGRSVVTLKGISKGTQLMKIPTSISLVASPSRSARVSGLRQICTPPAHSSAAFQSRDSRPRFARFLGLANLVPTLLDKS